MPHGRTTNTFRSSIQRGITPLSTIMLILMFLTSVIGEEAWLLDITTFFWPYILVASFLFLIVTFAFGKRIAMVMAAFSLIIAILPFATLPHAPVPGKSTGLRIITANLFMQNEAEPAEFVAFLQIEKPDIVVLQETNERWQTAISNAGIFPYQSSNDLRARNDMKVFSRIPIAKETMLERLDDLPGHDKRRPLRLELGEPGNLIVLYAIHPDTPRSPAQWRNRNAYFDTVAQSVSFETTGTRIIVAGDWNLPPWSAYFSGFFQSSGLLFTRDGTLPVLTRFSRRIADLMKVGTMIDHVAVSNKFGLVNWRTGPDFGSNHLPVIVDLSVD